MRVDNQPHRPDPRLDAEGAERRAADKRGRDGFGQGERFDREGSLREQPGERDFGRHFGSLGAGTTPNGRGFAAASPAEDAARGQFEDKLRLAGAKHGGGDGAAHEKASDEGARLLALAGTGAAAMPPTGFGGLSTPEFQGAAQPAARVAGIEDLSLRVERAAEAALAVAAGGEPLRIDFPVPGTGIGGLTLTITPDAIDLVFLCDEAGMGALASAAQSLADRLHARWPGRVVRIHEKAAAGEAEARAAGDGLSEISQLLGRGGARS